MSTTKRIVADMNSLLDKTVVIKLANGRSYSGQLSSYELSPFMIGLINAKDNENNTYYKVVINGNVISEIIVKSSPVFDVREFADLLQKSLGLRPGDIKLYEEIGIITVMERIKVSESGVEGSGPMAQRIYDIYNDYIAKRKKGDMK
ncbi:Lsm family RNA-binding protein [Metallosphaera hakonensis]|uniref:Sm ribonucleo n=1 Tax=Metallosphaera hakonensis JCM 8857 = DSM 7519 TaxID=1293036 RepID=A0A2U9ITV2_9CREN|nr:Lsm family RNA-binding protein [Metallosphaera hakonensis]AWR99456.1 Sm ribonucleo [Metallosphaera hakonensis JCM 8857 = DSM 7519]